MTDALDGIRILDLSGGIAGPLGVLQLAEHGADVLKIEPPTGRPDRGEPASRAHNRSRRSVTLDLKDPEGVRLFHELCASADVLVEAFAPGTMERLGLGYDAVHEAHPHLVYCSVPAWPSGVSFSDRPGYEALVHARTGQQWENPSFRPGPVFLHSPVASHGAALLVPVGIVAALLARDTSGRGQHVEISLLQGALALTTQNWNWTEQGKYSLAKTYPGVHQASIYECADGKWIHAATMSGIEPTMSEGEVLGVGEVSLMGLMFLPPDEREIWEDKVLAAFRSWDRDELVDAFHAAGYGAEAIIPPHERFTHPQLLATDSVVQVDDPELGRLTQVGPSLFMEGTPGRVRGPQPVLGAHTDEVLRELGHDDDELASLRARGVI
jgi:crotonobetainyl-CoA:carnitine CoA-transferase CaiB-like acyl-CoA transferase